MPLSQLYRHSLALLTDLYQLTMAYGYWKLGRAEQQAVFHLFFRTPPFGSGYTLAATHEPPPTAAPVPAPPASPPETPVRSLRDELSMYYLSLEVSTMWRGIDLMIPQNLWHDQFANLTSQELADRLRTLAANANLPAFRKRPPSKRPSPRSPTKKPGSHVSTAKTLAGVPPKQK